MITTLQELITELCKLPFSTERIEHAMRIARLHEEEISKFINFNRACYTRNLIHRTHDFELLTLCWEHGQQTPLHDHNNSAGWMLNIRGCLTETRYQFVAGPVRKLEKVGAGPAGNVSYIDDSMGLHILHNDSGSPAITLHLYAPPIVECHYYDPVSLAQRTATMRYHTVDGVPCTTIK